MLSTLQRSALVSEIRADPDHFVGQDEMALSTAPVWLGHKLEPRPLVLRMYVAAAGDSYAVMPGGLTRVAAHGDVPIVSMQRGGGSKDTWVLSDGPVSPMSLLAPPSVKIQRERRSGDLPSRVADNLFWLGRYAERVEHSVRLLRSVVSRLTDDSSEVTHERTALIRVLVSLELVPAGLRTSMPVRELEQQFLSSVFKQGPGTRLRETLEELRRIASDVRDRLSIDTWRILNQLRQDFRQRHGRVQLDEALLQLNRMITDLAAFSGMEMENMTRGHGWRFLDIGRRLERSANMTMLLRASLTAGSPHQAMLGPLLEIADSTMTYRRRYFAQPQLAPVLDLLVARSHATPGRWRFRWCSSPITSINCRAIRPPRLPHRSSASSRDCQRRSPAPISMRWGSPRRMDRCRRLTRCWTRSPTICAACRTRSRTTTSVMRRSVSADELPVTFDIVHATRYAYTESVSVSHHVARLSPRALPHQACLDHELDVDPAPAVLSTHTDYFGNDTTFFAMQRAHRGLTVTARSRVRVAPRSAPAPADTPPWETCGRSICAAARCARGALRCDVATRRARVPGVRAPVVPGRASAARGRRRSHHARARRLHLRYRGDDGDDVVVGSVSITTRGLSGLHALRDCLPAIARLSPRCM